MDPKTQFERSPLYFAKFSLLVVSFFASVFGLFFCIWKNNHYATTSFLFLELSTAILLRLHSKHQQGQLFTAYNHCNLKFFLVFGCVMLILSIVFTVFLLVDATKFETEFNFVNNNSYFAFVPCLVSNIWFLVLVYDVREFMRLRPEQYGAQSGIQ